jgi:hypothetical protein
MMAKMDDNFLKRILARMDASEALELLGPAIKDYLNGVDNPGIAGQMGKAFVLKNMSVAEREMFKEMDEVAKDAALERKLKSDEFRSQLRQEETAQTHAERRETAEHRQKLDLEKAREMKGIEFESKQREKAAAAFPEQQKLQKLYDTTKLRIGDPQRPLPLGIDDQVKMLEEAMPTEGANLREKLGIRRAKAANEAEALYLESIKGKTAPRTEPLELVKSQAQSLGVVDEVVNQKAVDMTRQLHSFDTKLRRAGFTAEPTYKLEPGQPPKMDLPGLGKKGIGDVPLLRSAAEKEAIPLVQKAFKASMAGAEAEPLLAKAAKSITSGRMGRAGLGAGLLSLLLLPLLSGKKEQGMNPMMQMQMMQQMLEAQQKQELVNSLVTSRAASADRNMAQADLLRLKALAAQPRTSLIS